MEKSVQNQKVFVSLSAVMEVQKRYLDVCAEYKRIREDKEVDGRSASGAYYSDRKRMME